MAKIAFISGITGQDGAYLSRFLLGKGYEVHGGVRRSAGQPTGRLHALGVAGDVTLHDFDLLEESNVRRVLDRVAPDEIYNLAAQSFVGTSFEQPLYTANVDALGPLRLLEALRESGSKARFYQASTSEMFGNVDTVAQNEATPFRPRSPYGVAKLFAHWTTVNYREGFELPAVSGILFNHESPLRGQEFVTRKITLALARMAAGQQDVLRLGNLDARRDWGFAGDFVEGMWLMLQRERPDDYVLATGEARSIRCFVERAARYWDWEIEWSGRAGAEIGRDRPSGKVLVRADAGLLRPTEVPCLVGDPSRAEGELGWIRRVAFDQLVDFMCEADAARVGSGTLVF